jgi:hypothetical protein
MATIVNNFDKFVKQIQRMKDNCRREYEGQLYCSNSSKCVLLHERYATLIDILTVASTFSENNVKIEE